MLPRKDVRAFHMFIPRLWKVICNERTVQKARPNSYKKFATSIAQRKHINSSHLGKSFTCTICKKDFSNISNLNKHKKIYTLKNKYNIIRLAGYSKGSGKLLRDNKCSS